MAALGHCFADSYPHILKCLRAVAHSVGRFPGDCEPGPFSQVRDDTSQTCRRIPDRNCLRERRVLVGDAVFCDCTCSGTGSPVVSVPLPVSCLCALCVSLSAHACGVCSIFPETFQAVREVPYSQLLRMSTFSYITACGCLYYNQLT